MKRLTYLLGLCVLLAACGGGGGGNGGGSDNGGGGGGSDNGGGGAAACTPASGQLQITDDNADTVSAEAYDATTTIPTTADADYVFLLFGVVASTQSTNSLLNDLPQISKDGVFKKQLRSNTMLYNLNSNPLALPIRGTFNCQDGGSYTREINDADNNNLFSAGDVITLTFSNCQIADSSNSRVALNGQLITKLELVTNNSLDQFPIKATFTHNGFTMQVTSLKLAGTVTLDGDITATLDCPTSGCQIFRVKAEVTDLAVALKYPPGRSVISWRVTDSITESDLDNNSQESTFSGNGNLYIDSSGNAVSFATTAANPFKERKADDYPYAGEEVSTGACNSSVKLTVLDNQNVQVAVDANGDGAYEVTNNMTWSDFMQQEQ